MTTQRPRALEWLDKFVNAFEHIGNKRGPYIWPVTLDEADHNEFVACYKEFGLFLPQTTVLVWRGYIFHFVHPNYTQKDATEELAWLGMQGMKN